MDLFITEKRSCKHLNIDILPVSGKDVGAKRNKDRKIYDTCKKCLKLTKEELKRTTVFITDYGVKYHTEINCPDLTTESARCIAVAGRRESSV